MNTTLLLAIVLLVLVVAYVLFSGRQVTLKGIVEFVLLVAIIVVVVLLVTGLV